MILIRVEDRLFNGLIQAIGLVLGQGVQLIQAFDKKQVDQLLNNRERVGYAAGSHGVPDAVHLGFEFSGDHNLCVLLAGLILFSRPLLRFIVVLFVFLSLKNVSCRSVQMNSYC